ncbi:hypothetical protein J3R73_001076 [Labrys monachus]|uniref:Uncharacterized protein n=1 Tax=Labrys monachus TaxID=217067 RepID=A0ABU0F9J8_9HYPH|nr:hypothetical protein [Labrys monachus]
MFYLSAKLYLFSLGTITGSRLRSRSFLSRPHRELDVVGERDREVAVGWFSNASFVIRAIIRIVRDDERASDEPAFKQAKDFQIDAFGAVEQNQVFSGRSVFKV